MNVEGYVLMCVIVMSSDSTMSASVLAGFSQIDNKCRVYTDSQVTDSNWLWNDKNVINILVWHVV